MDAELLSIGSELTSGAIVNTNAAYLARRLADVGISCSRQVTVGDERATLIDALTEALSRCELLIITGGLGPTFDDITMEAVAEAVHRPLIAVPEVAVQIRRFYTRRRRALQRAALRQASIPQGGLALQNPIGTAPGLWLRLPTTLLIALPGVPGEMRAIMQRHVLPRLRRAAGTLACESRTLRTIGVVELSIEGMLRRLRIPPQIRIGLYPHLRTVDVRLSASAPSVSAVRRCLARVEHPLRRALGLAVYGTGEETLEGVAGALLARQRKTLAVAESCTGGLVSDWITNVPDSSRYLRGSVVAYSNDIKRRQLGVSPSMLERCGAVSAQTAEQMAAGVRTLLGADVGLAITGIAGPTGGSLRKPVGLVCLGLADQRGTKSQRLQFFGDRDAIKIQAAQTALDWLRRYLLTPRSSIVHHPQPTANTK